MSKRFLLQSFQGSKNPMRAMIAAAAAGLVLTGCNTDTGVDGTESSSSSSADTMSSSSEASTSSVAGDYNDGTYESTGNYTSPAGEEAVVVGVTLEDGVITAATFEGMAEHEVSVKLQGMFAEGFEEEVVGMNIDDVSLSVVNGSSLVPKGFMDALEQIKLEASA